jgi:hypothetical protein
MKRKIEIDLNLNYEELSEGFWNLDSEEQAMFFNHLAKNKKFDIAMQLEYIRQEEVLNSDARELMKTIGDYAYND